MAPRANAVSGERPRHAAIIPRRVGRHVFTVEAWWDEYATFCRDLEIKRKAGTDVTLEIEEGRRLLDEARQRLHSAAEAPMITEALSRLAGISIEARADILLAPDVRKAMAECDPRKFLFRHKQAFSNRSRAAAGGIQQLVRALSALGNR